MSARSARSFEHAPVVLAAILLLAVAALGQARGQVLYSFPSDGPNGHFPTSLPLFDRSGNVFGIASLGGDDGYGTAYELTVPLGGVNNFSLIYTFSGAPEDEAPFGNIVSDAAGNIYGVAAGGTAGASSVYELSPGAGGIWTESVIYTFNNTGGGPWEATAGLTIDAAGNLYGSSGGGGAFGMGTIYELTPNADGSWSETVLYSFNSSDGYAPSSALVFDASGNIYGTTSTGGIAWGTVFELSPTSGGGWTEKVLYSLPGSASLAVPNSPVWLDSAGNIFATAFGVGYPPHGAVFELTKGSKGSWTETTLHAFSGKGGEGAAPNSGLIADSDGNLYGTTYYGGTYGGGAIYVMKKDVGGQWREKTIYSFQGKPDGLGPNWGLTFGPGGDLYGVTTGGGSFNSGTVYRVKP
jgi:uncharacterized repeat protein (TIGR03803 family)